MRKSRAVLAALATMFALLLQFTSVAAAAGPSACARAPRDAVAQLCGDVDEKMYGAFATFIYPDMSYGPFGSAPADFYNETQFFTDDAMTKSFAFGVKITYLGSETDYQPYWVDFTNGTGEKKIGSRTTVSDHKNHTFMALPTCTNCTTWDIYYDYNKVGTTGTQPNALSHHIMTGWDLTWMPGQVAFTQTSNHIRYLTGNNVFSQFRRDTISFRAPDGNCSKGASPLYCWHFTTAVSTVAGTAGDYVSSWNVSKAIVNPKTAAANQQRAVGPTAESDDREIDALVALADRLVAQKYANQ